MIIFEAINKYTLSIMLGIYTRISKDRPNQVSTEVQKEQGIKLASKLNIPYKLYEEEKGTSGGKKIEDRIELTNLVTDIESDIITSVYFYNQDRSTRDEITWFTLAELFIEKNIALYENGNLVDLNDSDTFMLTGFKAVMNASSRRKTGKKIKDALNKLAKDGKATNPVLPYGYAKDKDKNIITDDEEIKVVKRIFQMSLDGIGADKTAIIFNEEKDGPKTRYAKTAKGTLTTKNKTTGVITTKNKANVKWSGATILQIIKNSWYYGERKYKGEIFQVPAFLDKDYCLNVIDNLQKNRKHTGKETHQYLLKGVLQCSCGCNMYGKINLKQNENYYHCSSKRINKVSCGSPSINRPRLDSLIWSLFFENDKLIKLVAKHFEDTDEKELLIDLDKKLKTLETELTSKGKELKNAITLTTKGIITENEAEVELKRIRTEKNDITIQILNIQNQITTYQNVMKSSEDIIEDIMSYKNKVSFNDKELMIKKYIKNIIVNYTHNHFVINIHWNIPKLGEYNVITNKRFYYVFEPFLNKAEIFNKFDKVKKGKVIPRTDEEFLNDVYKEKQTIEVFTIQNEIIFDIMKSNNLMN